MKKPILFACLCLFLLLFSCAAHADVVITEVMALNGVYENEHAYDWIEVWNNGKKTVDLTGWRLSDSKKTPDKFVFPKGAKLKGGEYLIVYCTGEAEGGSKGSGSVYYAPFAISASGETVRLYDAGGEELQSVKLPAQYGCISYGMDASGNWGYFETATKGKKNTGTVCAARTEAPELVTKGGFYQDAVTVTVMTPEGSTVRYTTDGETPTEKSPVFPSGGLTIRQTTPVRVKAFRENEVSSPVVSATYLIGEEQPVPVVCLISDDKYLFSSKTGALVKGTGSTPNYAKELEYPTNIEFYNADGICEINQMGTFTCSAHSARVNPQKSIALYARSAYGESRFAFNPFPTRDYDSYKSILLRGANSDAYATRLRDVIASSLAEDEGILYQDALCIEVYINGKYWGHYNLREKINKHFIAQYEGVENEDDIDNIDILARTGRDRFVQNGDNTDWLSLCDFCKTKDLNVPENLAYVEERLDIDNMFTHAAYEIILGNIDFTNVRVYRVPGGKWRYLLFDVEACWRNLDKTPIEYYIKPLNATINGFRHEPLNALFKVPEMKARFLRRVAELLEKHFQWSYVESKFDFWTSQLEVILPRHIARWKNIKYSNWVTNINAIKYYARVRPKKIPGMLKQAMKLTDAEMETYFGDVLRLLEITNTK